MLRISTCPGIDTFTLRPLAPDDCVNSSGPVDNDDNGRNRVWDRCLFP